MELAIIISTYFAVVIISIMFCCLEMFSVLNSSVRSDLLVDTIHLAKSRERCEAVLIRKKTNKHTLRICLEIYSYTEYTGEILIIKLLSESMQPEISQF